MLTRIRHCDKNIASAQQPGISGLRPKPMLHLQASYTTIATVFGCYAGRYKQCYPDGRACAGVLMNTRFGAKS